MPLVRGLFGNLEALVFGSAVGNDITRPGMGVLAAGFHDSVVGEPQPWCLKEVSAPHGRGEEKCKMM